MKWNWQQANWPEFIYNASALKELEDQFIAESFKLIGATSIVTEEQKQAFTIELMSEEALKSSKIEGDLLNRNSVRSSLLLQFGLNPDYSDNRSNDKERGIAAVMADNYRSYSEPLSHERLFDWHSCIVTKSLLVHDVGIYRTSPNPTRVVSGSEGREKVHFEAPPANNIAEEMNAFIRWFNDTSPAGKRPLPALTRAGIVHLYFVAIHPFDDGNGRIARALCEKALTQGMKQPGLFALSHAIEKSRAEYYKQLELNNKGLNIDSWLAYFAETIVDATRYSQKNIRFIVAKTRLFDRLRGQINLRQEKVLLRMFDEGMRGFKGGLSTKNYLKITHTAQRNASRDLARLVELEALTKTGKLKGTRYWLNLGGEFEIEKRKHLLR